MQKAKTGRATLLIADRGLKLARRSLSLAAAHRGFAFCLGDPSPRLRIAD
jgi:hypothetical protein